MSDTQWLCGNMKFVRVTGTLQPRRQHLERANAKQLTRNSLDADPMLLNYYVNLRTLTQELEESGKKIMLYDFVNFL
ncbi:hypothetical protein NQ314_006161 [Rhamnusium bicolor]|uniref:Uncharacterized protein n=1 Tax=Rhamnusium bicolor TaxID=1586634 RepID=A0AAV8Z6N3_9CUCU|nr:hypothetical protein NQ314_006161 [Rhamnusium bicolor]